MANASIYAAFERMWQHIVAAIGNKSDISHNHDDMYYTEIEIDTKVSDINTSIAELATSKSDTSHNHDDAYDILGSASDALNSAKSYTDTKTSDLISATAADNKISAHNTHTSAHNDIRLLISNLSTKLNNFLDVDDTTTDQLSEVITLINNNKGTLESLTTSKINVSDIVDNLTTSSASKVLSAKQGAAIRDLIDALQEELDTHTHAIADVTGLQTALDGKADSSHGTHVSYGTTAPVMDGAASVGSATTVARSDHKHPTDTSRAAKTDFDTHVADTTKHITATERTNWDAAYTHSTSTHARTDATKVADSTTNGNILINETETNVYSHPNSGVTAGTYKSVTVNAQGHVTAGSNPTTLSGYGITDAETKTDASAKLTEAKTYADNAATTAAAGKADKTDFDTHTSDTTKHITATERTNWEAAYTHSQAAHAPSNAEKNQNAFSNITVGSTTVAADTITDTVTFVGSNVTITPDATNDKITFAVADGSTSAAGIVKLTNSTSSTSTTTAATPSSVKSAYDLANTAKTNAATAQSKADSAYTLAESKVDSLSDLGITATAAELNYVDGVTSNIQTQLNDKVSMDLLWSSSSTSMAATTLTLTSGNYTHFMVDFHGMNESRIFRVGTRAYVTYTIVTGKTVDSSSSVHASITHSSRLIDFRNTSSSNAKVEVGTGRYTYYNVGMSDWNPTALANDRVVPIKIWGIKGIS